MKNRKTVIATISGVLIIILFLSTVWFGRSSQPTAKSPPSVAATKGWKTASDSTTNNTTATQPSNTKPAGSSTKPPAATPPSSKSTPKEPSAAPATSSASTSPSNNGSSAPAPSPSNPAPVSYGRRYSTTTTQTGNQFDQIVVNPGTYNRVFFDGMVYIGTNGTYTFQDCEIAGKSWGVFFVDPSTTSAGGVIINMDHCTLRRATAPNNDDSAGSGVIHGRYTGTFTYNDISGMGDGVQIADSNVTLSYNWIHNLAVASWGAPNDCGTSTHNDGIQIYGGATNLEITNNVIEPPDGASYPCSNSAIFTQGVGQSGVIRNNQLKYGGYTLYLENGTYAVTGNTITAGKWGTHQIEAAVTITEWQGNTNAANGQTLNQ